MHHPSDTLFRILFLNGTEPVVRYFSSILYTILVHGTRHAYLFFLELGHISYTTQVLGMNSFVQQKIFSDSVTCSTPYEGRITGIESHIAALII
jgi:hypothetical protein